ncbi:MAG: outer membrane beta-barrel protein [Gemmatimonadota bacterium]
MKRILTGAAVLGFSIFASATVSAQAMGEMANKTPVQFGVLGGATFPVSDYKSVLKTGWNAGAFVNLGIANWPVGVRIDGQWNQFAVKNLSGVHFRDLHGTADLVANVGNGKAVKFYVLGGVGVYNIKATGSNDGVDYGSSKSATKFGLNGGAGFKFNVGSLSPFVEARYHYVFLNGNDFSNNGSNPKFQMIPVSIGLSF